MFTRNVQAQNLIRHEDLEVGPSPHKLVSFVLQLKSERLQEKRSISTIIRSDLLKTNKKLKERYIDSFSMVSQELLTFILDMQQELEAETQRWAIQKVVDRTDLILSEAIMNIGKSVLGVKKPCNHYNELSSEKSPIV